MPRVEVTTTQPIFPSVVRETASLPYAGATPGLIPSAPTPAMSLPVLRVLGQLDNSYIIAPYIVALARGLLSINANNYDKLINNIERLHLKITRQPLNRTLKEALKEGSLNVFPLIVDLLPGVEAVDKNYIERLQRQAWAALIAA